jgi:hypothetical protein
MEFPLAIRMLAERERQIANCLKQLVEADGDESEEWHELLHEWRSTNKELKDLRDIENTL